jgi:hypothetical protein
MIGRAARWGASFTLSGHWYDMDWRVGHQGRDRMYYEELRDGVWQRLDVDGELLLGRAHHLIFFASPADWQRYPAWARDRRDEIIGRIKSVFHEPDYEYHGDDAT